MPAQEGEGLRRDGTMHALGGSFLLETWNEARKPPCELLVIEDVLFGITKNGVMRYRLQLYGY